MCQISKRWGSMSYAKHTVIFTGENGHIESYVIRNERGVGLPKVGSINFPWDESYWFNFTERDEVAEFYNPSTAIIQLFRGARLYFTKFDFENKSHVSFEVKMKYGDGEYILDDNEGYIVEYDDLSTGDTLDVKDIYDIKDQKVTWETVTEYTRFP